MGEGAAAVAGLAVGIAVIVLFASIFGTIDNGFSDNRSKIDIKIQGLKDTYASGERLALTVHISGYSTFCDSSPSFMIINSNSGKITHRYNGYPFMACNEGLYHVDRMLTTEGPDNQLGDIVINESGNYKLIVGQYGKTVEREFSIIAVDDDSATDSAVKITSDLNEVKEFFNAYPNANTTVYFITTCTDESCSTLQRIPSIIEYGYKAENQKYAQLRVTIDYEEGKPTFSQASCSVYGTEEESVGIYGPVPLVGVAELLQDSHCPDN